LQKEFSWNNQEINVKIDDYKISDKSNHFLGAKIFNIQSLPLLMLVIAICLYYILRSVIKLFWMPIYFLMMIYINKMYVLIVSNLLISQIKK